MTISFPVGSRVLWVAEMGHCWSGDHWPTTAGSASALLESPNSSAATTATTNLRVISMAEGRNARRGGKLPRGRVAEVDTYCDCAPGAVQSGAEGAGTERINPAPGARTD